MSYYNDYYDDDYDDYYRETYEERQLSFLNNTERTGGIIL